MADPKTVAIDEHGDLYLLYMEKRRALKDLEGEVKQLEQRLREAVGDGDQATIMDEVVITNFAVEKFQSSKLKADNPALYRRYIRPVMKDEFDSQAFREAHPSLFARYQSRQWRPREK